MNRASERVGIQALLGILLKLQACRARKGRKLEASRMVLLRLRLAAYQTGRGHTIGTCLSHLKTA